MAKVKKIEVKVTYSVGLGDLNIPQKVLVQLIKLHQKGNTVQFGDLKNDETQKWILKNIKEHDCFHSDFEIVDLEPTLKK